MSLTGLTLNTLPLLDLEVPDENQAIQRTAELLKSEPAIIDFHGFVTAVFDRQKINPPILDNGVALPHARTRLTREIVFVAARCAGPVAFGPDARPVRLVFLFGIPPHRISEYLGMTALLVKRLRDPETLHGLLTAETVQKFTALLE